MNEACNGHDHKNGRTIPFAVAKWLHLAATPTFALMALWSGMADAGSMDALCPAPHGMALPGGMTVMYLLMSIFHAAPWLDPGSRRSRRVL